MMKNQRIVVTHPGGPEVLELIEEDLPEPQAGQVRVKILAAGVAYADVGVRLGTYPLPESSQRPVSPGYDIVGVVDALGPGQAPPAGRRAAPAGQSPPRPPVDGSRWRQEKDRADPATQWLYAGYVQPAQGNLGRCRRPELRLRAAQFMGQVVLGMGLITLRRDRVFPKKLDLFA
jgi:NADPH:quinone reductase-like Zn-dependent oxidoreductase